LFFCNKYIKNYNLFNFLFCMTERIKKYLTLLNNFAYLKNIEIHRHTLKKLKL